MVRGDSAATVGEPLECGAFVRRCGASAAKRSVVESDPERVIGRDTALERTDD